MYKENNVLNLFIGSNILNGKNRSVMTITIYLKIATNIYVQIQINHNSNTRYLNKYLNHKHNACNIVWKSDTSFQHVFFLRSVIQTFNNKIFD